jgi:hypothetical protein
MHGDSVKIVLHAKRTTELPGRTRAGVSEVWDT